mmetsp:Transcript_26430/g.56656  ORF Transcript_26430/g.56656 Transcript_26430/m.56656 type:complete len:318 (-) Transcript_26430:74-1027(-)
MPCSSSSFTTGCAKKNIVATATVFSCLVATVVVEGWILPTTQRVSASGPRSFSRHPIEARSGTTTALSFSSTVEDSSPDASAVEEVSGMRLSEIKTELKDRKVDFSDCFDKESMVFKLADARANNIDNSGNNENDTEDEEESSSTAASSGEFDREAALEELKGMRVRELREELGRRRIPRAGLFEKEDIVNALLEAREVASVYSGTGLMTPGEVSELSAEDVQTEIDHPGGLMLLDVYATWCGPCQMIAPFLKEIAAEQGDGLRVVKMDSDKNPQLSSELKVGGLPTLVLFQGGNEIDRLEGAPTKDQLVGWIESRR